MKLSKEQFLKTLPAELESAKMTKERAKDLAYLCYCKGYHQSENEKQDQQMKDLFTEAEAGK